MKRRSFGLLAIVFLPIAGTSVEAQSAPEAAVREFFKAEREGRWLDAARMMDLPQFEPFRRNMLRGMQMADTFARLTPEQLMKQEPNMPRAVAEYQIKEMNEGMRDFNFLEREYARVPTRDSLRALSTDEAAARWLEAKGPKWLAELARREELRHPQRECPEYPDSLVEQGRVQQIEPEARVLGATSGSDSIRFVVVGVDSYLRRAMSPADDIASLPGLSPHVITVRKIAGAWKIVPAFDMPNANGTIGGSIIATITCETKVRGDSVRK